MRKLIVCNIVSLDGFFSGPGGDVMAMPFDNRFSDYNAAIEKVVVSNSLKPDEVEGWGPTRVIRRASAHAEVAALKQGLGREILVFGSHVLWNDLLAAGLVDELHFMIGARVVGEGVRAFETRPPGPLRLLDTRTFDGSSLLLVRYAVER